jgi:hypothetical protein
MSRTYSISCKETKTKLWIGQTDPGKPGWRMYSALEYIKRLERFLTAHAGKELIFNDDEKLEDEYEEFEDDGEY